VLASKAFILLDFHQRLFKTGPLQFILAKCYGQYIQSCKLFWRNGSVDHCNFTETWGWNPCIKINLLFPIVLFSVILKT